MTRWFSKRWVWSALVAATVAVGFAAARGGEGPPKVGTVLSLNFDGKGERQYKVIKSEKQPDGSYLSEIQDTKTGETITLVDKPGDTPPAPPGLPSPPPGAPRPPEPTKTRTPAPSMPDPGKDKERERRPILGRIFDRDKDKDKGPPPGMPTTASSVAKPDMHADSGKKPGLIGRIFGPKKPAGPVMPSTASGGGLPSGMPSAGKPSTPPPAVIPTPPGGLSASPAPAFMPPTPPTFTPPPAPPVPTPPAATPTLPNGQPLPPFPSTTPEPPRVMPGPRSSAAPPPAPPAPVPVTSAPVTTAPATPAPMVPSVPSPPPVFTPPPPVVAPSTPAPIPTPAPAPLPPVPSVPSIPVPPASGGLPPIPVPPSGTSSARPIQVVVPASYVPAGVAFDREVQPFVIALQSMAAPSARLTAAKALADCRHRSTDGVKGALFQAAQLDPCGEVRGACITHLCGLGYFHPNFLGFIQAACDDTNPYVREAAKDACAKMIRQNK